MFYKNYSNDIKTLELKISNEIQAAEDEIIYKMLFEISIENSTIEQLIDEYVSHTFEYERELIIKKLEELNFDTTNLIFI